MNKQILITAVERLLAGIAGVEKQIKHRKQCGENGCRLTELYDYYCVNRDPDRIRMTLKIYHRLRLTF